MKLLIKSDKIFRTNSIHARTREVLFLLVYGYPQIILKSNKTQTEASVSNF